MLGVSVFCQRKDRVAAHIERAVTHARDLELSGVVCRAYGPISQQTAYRRGVRNGQAVVDRFQKKMTIGPIETTEQYEIRKCRAQAEPS